MQSSSQDEHLVAVYEAVLMESESEIREVGDLPYTKEFDQIYARVSCGDTQYGRHRLWLRLRGLAGRGLRRPAIDLREGGG